MKIILKFVSLVFILSVVVLAGCSSQEMTGPSYDNPDQVLDSEVSGSSLTDNAELSDSQVEKVKMQENQLERQKREIEDIKSQRYFDEKFKSFE